MKMSIHDPLITDDYSRLMLKYISFASFATAVLALPFSIKVCHLAIIIYLLCWLIEGNWYDKYLIIKTNRLLQLLIVFFLIELLSTMYTSRSSGWPELEKKLFLFLLPMALATTATKFSKKEMDIVFYLFVISCLIGSSICITNALNQINLMEGGHPISINIDYLGSSDYNQYNPDVTNRWLFLSYIALSQGIGIHPAYLSLYIAFSIAILLIKTHEQSGITKFASGTIILFLSLVVVLLSSRIVTLSLIIIFVVINIRMIIHRKLSASVALLALILVISSLVYFNPVSRYRNLQEIINTPLNVESNKVYRNSTEIRASLWWLGIKSYAQVNPFLGTGTGDVQEIIKSTSQEYNISNSLNTFDPHNQFLFILIGLGAFGLIIFLALIIFSIYHAFLLQDYLFAIFIFLFTTLCFTETVLERQKGIVFFAIFFSLQAFSVKGNNLRLSSLKTS
ncbi:MAG: hypothetical protein C0490_18760 [Marivirga sp.]|nr:hypothetical protein [Marivirga sp.]